MEDLLNIENNLANKFITPCGPLQDQAEDYFLSRLTQKQTMKLPLADEPPASTRFDIALAEQRLKNAMDCYNSVRKNRLKRAEELLNKWKELNKDSVALRRSFLKYDPFITSNEHKRARSELEIKRFDPTRQEENIIQTRKTIKNLESIAEAMEKQVQSLSIYEEFLIKVVNISSASHAVRSPDDAVERYMVLLDVRKQASELAGLLDHNAEAARKAMRCLQQTHGEKLIGMRTDRAKLQEKWNAVRAEALFWETNLSRALYLTAAHNTDIEKVKQSICNLYELTRAHGGQKQEEQKIIPDEHEATDVKLSIEDYQRLINEIITSIQGVERVLKISLNSEV